MFSSWSKVLDPSRPLQYNVSSLIMDPPCLALPCRSLCRLWLKTSHSGPDSDSVWTQTRPSSSYTARPLTPSLFAHSYNQSLHFELHLEVLIVCPIWPFWNLILTIKSAEEYFYKCWHRVLQAWYCWWLSSANVRHFGAVFQSHWSFLLCIRYHVKVMSTSVSVPGDACRRDLLTAWGQICRHLAGWNILQNVCTKITLQQPWTKTAVTYLTEANKEEWDSWGLKMWAWCRFKS